MCVQSTTTLQHFVNELSEYGRLKCCSVKAANDSHTSPHLLDHIKLQWHVSCDYMYVLLLSLSFLVMCAAWESYY